MTEVGVHVRRRRKRTLADVAYETLLRRIHLGDLPGGVRLTEAELCAALRMSRTPVREAINRLVRDGLLLSSPHRGVTVRLLRSKEIIELLYVREAFEVQAARLAAARITDGELAELNSMCDQMDVLHREGTAGSIYAARKLDAEFHLRLMVLSGVEALADLYRRTHLLQLAMFGRHWTRLPQFDGIADGDLLGSLHRLIVDGLASRDPLKAEAAIRESVRTAISYHRTATGRMTRALAASAEGAADGEPADVEQARRAMGRQSVKRRRR